MKAERAENFAKRIALTRLAYGAASGRPNLSRAQFAKELGIDEQTYSRYERAETVPKMSGLAAIRRLTGVSLDYLIVDAEQGALTPHRLLGKCQAPFGERLRMVRVLMEPDDTKVAQAMQVPVETYRDWESGFQPMPDPKREEFAHRFSVSIQFLQDGSHQELPLPLLDRLLQAHPGLWRTADTGTATGSDTTDQAAARAPAGAEKPHRK